MLLNVLLIIVILLLLSRHKKKSGESPVDVVKSIIPPILKKQNNVEVVVRPEADKLQIIDERASYYYNGAKPMDGDGVSDEDRRWYDTVFRGGASTKNELAMCHCGSSSDENCGCGKMGHQK